MLTFLTIIAPLFLTALGFIVYKHPKLGRNVCYILLFATIIIYAIIHTFNWGRQTAFSKSSTLAKSVSIYSYKLPDNINKDSINSPLTKYSYLSSILNNEVAENSVAMTLDAHEREVKKVIYETIDLEKEKIIDANSETAIYCSIFFAIILTFVVFSFVFNNMQNKKSITDNNTAP